MARIRSIKPEFCVSEQITECSVNARLLFILMWMHCDDYGNHPAKLMQLKAECFPCDPFTRDEMQAMVSELIDQGLIVEYIGDTDDAMYWHVTGWAHQLINRPGLAKYPKFTEGSVTLTEHSVSAPCCPMPDRKGRDRKGSISLCSETESSEPKSAGSGFKFPVKANNGREWELPADKLAEYEKTFEGLDVRAEIRKARQWTIDHKAKRKTPQGMCKFLTGWLSRANDSGRGQFVDDQRRQSEERQRQLAAEAERREAAERARQSRGSPSEFAKGAVKTVRDRDSDECEEKRRFHEQLRSVEGGNS